ERTLGVGARPPEGTRRSHANPAPRSLRRKPRLARLDLAPARGRTNRMAGLFEAVGNRSDLERGIGCEFFWSRLFQAGSLALRHDQDEITRWTDGSFDRRRAVVI